MVNKVEQGIAKPVLIAVLNSDGLTYLPIDAANPLPVQLFSALELALNTDNATGALITMEYEHHEVHAGSHFTYASAVDIGNAATVSFVLVTPNNTKWSHFGFEINGQAEYDLQIFEGATPDNLGIAVANPAVINNDRNSTQVNELVINGSPTLGGGSKGTLIFRTHAGSGKTTGGQAGTGQELILKQNTTYWVDLKNSTTSDNFIAWLVSWYEHTNKN